MGNHRRLVQAVIFFLFVQYSIAQTDPYIIYFTDKGGTSFTLDNPSAYLSGRSLQRRADQQILVDSSDIPVSSIYLDQIRSTGAEVIYSSKWINAAYIKADPAQYSLVSSFHFVRSSAASFKTTNVNNTFSVKQSMASSYSAPFTSFLGIDQMHQDGKTGEGVLIAVTDSGFPGTDTLTTFRHLWNAGAIPYYWDVADNEADVFNDDAHGTYMLSVLAAAQDNYTGTAPDASYLLLRTEVAVSESKLEEFHWLRAAEIADSCGADIISVSLGYTIYDNPAASYSYADMNGHTSIIALAADKAFDKGMLVICSAGNNGNTAWQHIGTPADAFNILATGSVNNDGSRSFFSSIGPSSDGRIKPDLCGPATAVYCINPDGSLKLTGGTSLASPMIAGMAAGLKQSFPRLHAHQLRTVLLRSADKFSSPDNNTGYGVPHYVKAHTMAALMTNHSSLIAAPNPFETGIFILKITPSVSPVYIEIKDIRGCAVYTQTAYAPEGIIDLSEKITGISAGVYFIQIVAEGKTDVIKWIKL